ncbi:MAG: DUF951 family protein [Clostridia bacterium]|nr:DUF951 family protein [Clostridia bacterium]
MEFFQQRAPLKQIPCKCQRLICQRVGDNIQISCSNCKKTVIIKTGGIEKALETFVYKKEPIVLNLKK